MAGQPGQRSVSLSCDGDMSPITDHHVTSRDRAGMSGPEAGRPATSGDGDSGGCYVIIKLKLSGNCVWLDDVINVYKWKPRRWFYLFDRAMICYSC